MSPEIWSVILLTLQVALVSTVLVMLPATVLGYVLARYEFWGKSLVSAIVGLPLVLPPTAVGFLLLRLFAVDGPLGRENLGFDFNILLNWKGAVIATATMSLPTSLSLQLTVRTRPSLSPTASRDRRRTPGLGDAG